MDLANVTFCRQRTKQKQFYGKLYPSTVFTLSLIIPY